MSPRFDGQSVLVIGGTCGIGEGIARAFRAAGATVIATCATPAECSPPGTIPLDIRAVPAVAAPIGGLPRLDRLVCTAGIIRRGAEQAPAVFAEVIEVNRNGAMRAASAARPPLAAARGTLTRPAGSPPRSPPRCRMIPPRPRRSCPARLWAAGAYPPSSPAPRPFSLRPPRPSSQARFCAWMAAAPPPDPRRHVRSTKTCGAGQGRGALGPSGG